MADLSALIGMQAGVGAVEKADQALARNQQSVDEVLAPKRAGTEAEKAKFGWPDALVAGAGAAAVFGGPIGLVIGAAAGLARKNFQQNINDAMTASGTAYDDAYNMVRQGMLEDYNNATTEANRTIVSNNLRNLDASKELLKNPATQGLGEAGYNRAIDAHEQYLANNEIQAIDAKTQRDQAALLLGQEVFERHEDNLAEYDMASQNNIALAQRGQNILDFMAEGDTASVIASLATLPLALNPQAGATTDGEVQLWTSVAPWAEQIVERIRKETGEGGGMSGDTRTEIGRVVRQLMQRSASFQALTDAEYKQRAINRGVTGAFLSEYNSSRRLPGYAEKEMKLYDDTSEQGQLLTVMQETSSGASDLVSWLYNNARERTADAFEAADNAPEKFWDFYEGSGREERMRKRSGSAFTIIPSPSREKETNP